MRLRPSTPESLPSPSGNREDVELSRSAVEATALAHTKITFAKYSRSCRVTASRTRTPVARCLRSS